MKLPRAARRQLGRQLLDSSAPVAPADLDEVEATWNAEISRRLRAYRDGEVSLLTEDEVRDLLDR